ncbi:MAG: EamA family transporter [Candidatus Dormibacteraceae bacterium]
MFRENAYRPDSKVLAAFTAMVLIGGANYVAVRLSDRGLAPLYGAGVRFLGASVLLCVFLAWRRIALPTREQLKGTLLYGFLGFAASYACAYLALVSLSAGVAAVIMGSVPLITLLLAVAQRVERFRLRGLVGATIAIAGIVVLVGTPSREHFPVSAIFLMLGAAFSASESSIVLKIYPTGHPMATNTVAMAFGGVLLLGLSVVSGEHWSLPASSTTWASLMYLVILGSIGFFALFLFTLKRWTASRVSYMFVLTPIVASVSGAALTGEAVTAAMIVGGATVLFGVYVGALSGSRAPAPRSMPAREPEAVGVEVTK